MDTITIECEFYDMEHEPNYFNWIEYEKNQNPTPTPDNTESVPNFDELSDLN